MPIVQNLISFEGRLRRRDFWISMLIIMVASWVLRAVIGVALFPVLFVERSMYGSGMGAMSAGWGIAWLILLWPWLAVAVKRCHDRNKTGVWVLLAFVPVIGWLWCLIDLGLLDGTPGPNQYGPSPKDVGGPAEAVPAA